MPLYNFKTIAVVPTAKDFVEIVLSLTQRKTPTVIRKGFKISRIRAFYVRKVKYAQQTYHDRLSRMLEEFPRLDVSEDVERGWMLRALAFSCRHVVLAVFSRGLRCISVFLHSSSCTTHPTAFSFLPAHRIFTRSMQI
jgi:hypothetical protein